MSELSASEEPPHRRESMLTLPVLLVLGWLIVETTHMPGLAAMTMCLKFGWEDFRTAFWLRRNDPNRGRAKACFWLYLSSGLWRVAVTAILMMILIVLLIVFLQPPQPQQNFNAPPQRRDHDTEGLIKGALITAALAFLLSCLATFRAVWFGLSHRVQFWLSSGVHRARRHDEWPPLYGRSNWAAVLIITVLLLSFMVISPFAVMFVFGLLEGAGLKVKDPIKALTFVFMYIFVAPMFILLIRDALVRRLVAEHPVSCWGTEPRLMTESTDDPYR